MLFVTVIILTIPIKTILILLLLLLLLLLFILDMHQFLSNRKAHLAPFLPGHPVVKTGGELGIGPVSAAPWGSASILPISWAYLKMMGDEGLVKATQIALLNANYMKERLKSSYKILYTNDKGMCAHEFIIDCRPFQEGGIEGIDIAKRLHV